MKTYTKIIIATGLVLAAMFLYPTEAQGQKTKFLKLNKTKWIVPKYSIPVGVIYYGSHISHTFIQNRIDSMIQATKIKMEKSVYHPAIKWNQNPLRLTMQNLPDSIEKTTFRYTDSIAIRLRKKYQPDRRLKVSPEEFDSILQSSTEIIKEIRYEMNEIDMQLGNGVTQELRDSLANCIYYEPSDTVQESHATSADTLSLSDLWEKRNISVSRIYLELRTIAHSMLQDFDYFKKAKEVIISLCEEDPYILTLIKNDRKLYLGLYVVIYHFED